MTTAEALEYAEHLDWIRWQLDQLASCRVLRELPPCDLERYRQLMKYERYLLLAAPGASAPSGRRFTPAKGLGAPSEVGEAVRFFVPAE